MRPALVLISLVALLSGCGDGENPPAAPVAEAVAGHIHGVGVDPADGSLYVATHSGLFRALPEEARAARVGESRQDTMGFTVTGPRSFLGSGHPDDPDLPPMLGLIRSTNGGRSWEPVSLLGEADFHVLRAAGARVYGFDTPTGRLTVSSDGGTTWQERRPPGFLLDLAIDPADPDRIVASMEAGLAISRDAGRSWRPLASKLAGLLAWNEDGLVLVDGRGDAHRSEDGRAWRRVGAAGAAPAALSSDGRDLHVGLHTNQVMVSRDGGRTWRLRASL